MPKTNKDYGRQQNTYVYNHFHWHPWQAYRNAPLWHCWRGQAVWEALFQFQPSRLLLERYLPGETEKGIGWSMGNEPNPLALIATWPRTIDLCFVGSSHPSSTCLPKSYPSQVVWIRKVGHYINIYKLNPTRSITSRPGWRKNQGHNPPTPKGSEGRDCVGARTLSASRFSPGEGCLVWEGTCISDEVWAEWNKICKTAGYGYRTWSGTLAVRNDQDCLNKSFVYLSWSWWCKWCNDIFLWWWVKERSKKWWDLMYNT